MSARPAAPESLVSRRRSALAATTGPRRKKPIDYSCSAETSTPRLRRLPKGDATGRAAMTFGGTLN